jgi:peptidoglycan/xylan/chitin deacetylase (PgdA/CDA1 family)
MIFAVCFLVGTGGILLIRGHGGEALSRLWPWGRPAKDDGGANIVIHPGQTLRLPTAGNPGGAGPPRPTVEVPQPPKTVSRVAAGQQMVALTFDAGWEHKPAVPLLDVLREHSVRVTFFPRAKWLEDNPQLAEHILRDGHEIGSHSYTHPDLTKISDARIEEEIALAKAALVRLGGERAFLPFYRPPYGAHNSAVSAALARHGYGWVVMWQVDSLDWQETSTVESIKARVLDRLTDGGIALLHVGTFKTVEALPQILEALAQRNLKVVRVSELLGLDFGVAPAEPTYTVRAGDTLYGIARAHGTTVEALLELNPELRRK